MTDLPRPAARPRRSLRLVRVAALLAAGLWGCLLGGLALAAPAAAAPVAHQVLTVEPAAPAPTPTPTPTPAPTPDSTSSTPAPVAPATPGPTGPEGPAGPDGADGAGGAERVELDGLTDEPSTPVVTILALTMLSVAPAVLLTCTSFTKILIVLGLTRNALGLQQTPPNQVLAGLALFLSLFVMAPVLSAVNEAGVQPYLGGEVTAAAAFDSGVEPLKKFMLKNTDDDELKLLTNVADRDLPRNRADVSLPTLVPAFILTELKQAFIIGFIIFIPFLVIDIVVSGALMALGMMMMPPVTVSLPFKLLLFVMVDGWAMVIKSLVASYG